MAGMGGPGKPRPVPGTTRGWLYTRSAFGARPALKELFRKKARSETTAPNLSWDRHSQKSDGGSWVDCGSVSALSQV